MNKSLRLAALTVLALMLTCMCLAMPIHGHRPIRTGCVLGCGNYCRAFGMATYKSCTSCYCYQPAPVVGCSGSAGTVGYTGCNGETSGGCEGSGCSGGWGGCGGGGGGGCGGC
jgi:hypothetical protein